MRYGYIRVSTSRQAQHGTSLESQRQALIAAGVEADRIFEDGGRTGTNTDRPGFQSLQIALHDGDEVCITMIDRLSRSLQDTVNIISDWKRRGITLTVTEQGISTAGTFGELAVNLLAVIAETEHSLILERTERGRQAALANGRICHRKPTWTDKDAKRAGNLKGKWLTVAEVGRAMQTSTTTAFRMIQRARELGINTEPPKPEKPEPAKVDQSLVKKALEETKHQGEAK